MLLMLTEPLVSDITADDLELLLSALTTPGELPVSLGPHAKYMLSNDTDRCLVELTAWVFSPNSGAGGAQRAYDPCNATHLFMLDLPLDKFGDECYRKWMISYYNIKVCVSLVPFLDNTGFARAARSVRTSSGHRFYIYYRSMCLFMLVKHIYAL